MSTVKAYAAKSATQDMVPFNLERREPTAEDVHIEIFYCRYCHSYIHTVR